MSWTARVRDNAQTRLKKAPVSLLPWSNPAATATGHFRPTYGAHDDQEVQNTIIAPHSQNTNVEPQRSWGSRGDEDTVLALTASTRTTTGLTSTINSATANGGSDALAWMNAEDMDPFVGHEREAANALQGIRRSMNQFLHSELKEIIFVKISAAPPLLTNPELSAPSPAETDELAAQAAAANSKKSSKPPKGASPKPQSETPSGPPPGAGVAACNALLTAALTSACTRSLSLEKAQLLLQRLEEAAATGAVNVARADAGDTMNHTNPSRSKTATPQPSTARNHPKKGGAMTPQESSRAADDGAQLVPVPDRMLAELKLFVKDVAHIVRSYDEGIDALMTHYKCTNSSSSEAPHTATTTLPSLGNGVAPCQLSKGLSMAARELALQQTDNARSVRRKAASRSVSPSRQQDSVVGGFGALTDPDVVAACIDVPSCGEYLVGRTVMTFGRCDVSQLSAHVICGNWSPRETILLWVLKCLQDAGGSIQRDHVVPSSDDNTKKAPPVPLINSLLALLPQRVSIGIGWQRHPVYGAVTVCLATPKFVELPFTTQRSLLPIGEIARYVTNGLASRQDISQFPIQFSSAVHVAEFKAIRAVAPTSHPIEPLTSSEVQLLLDVPITVDIACTVVQVDAPPQTPFYGRKTIDAEMKLARRKGKPLSSVPQEPRCSSSICLVDFPPSALGTATRVTVRLVSHRNATLHIFAKLNGQSDASFHQVSSVQIQPAYSEEAWFAAQGVASNPLHTVGLPVTSEMFQRWRGCVVSPMCDTVVDGAAMVPFEVYLPHDTQVCVLKGAHGETLLKPQQPRKTATLLPAASPSLSAVNVSIDAMSPIPQDSEASVGEKSILPPLPSGRRASSTQRGDALTTLSVSSSDSSLRKRRGGSRANTTLFKGVLHRAREGPLQLWVDGFVVCQWTVSF
ncbi:Hypothetical protein, putative [Bodo saltans]|uniref:Uncharacterized protein n=1 Tax=Bodo saltans TaxID=75058 RepID=A0A0S4JA61_BODSA|nr:Hypothetical protein, putative [Bodo saltans]|eukprot:CUG87115.1 Hypothetical protein, putative [Bodo saltans]